MQTRALAAVAPGLASYRVASAINTSVFTPTAAGDQELMPSPAVTATIGTTGNALLLVSSTVSVNNSPTAAQYGIIYYSWTPQGGSQHGPGSNQVLRFGNSTPGPTLALTDTPMGIVPLSGLPAGNTAFNLYASSGGSQGASFINTSLVVWPL